MASMGMASFTMILKGHCGLEHHFELWKRAQNFRIIKKNSSANSNHKDKSYIAIMTSH